MKSYVQPWGEICLEWNECDAIKNCIYGWENEDEIAMEFSHDLKIPKKKNKKIISISFWLFFSLIFVCKSLYLLLYYIKYVRIYTWEFYLTFLISELIKENKIPWKWRECRERTKIMGSLYVIHEYKILCHQDVFNLLLWLHVCVILPSCFRFNNNLSNPEHLHFYIFVI